MATKTIVVLEGDETGQELLEEALRVLQPDVIGLELEFPRFDLSLEKRPRDAEQGRARGGARDPGARPRAEGGDDHAGGHGDVGSPNRILREEIGGRVIVRTGRRIPGVVPLGGVHAPISIVRMAVGDAYGANEWREGAGDDEAAFRTERIERRICHSVAEFAFRHAGAHRREGVRRPEVHGEPDLRGDAQGGDGCGGGAASGRALRAAVDRRDVRVA